MDESVHKKRDRSTTETDEEFSSADGVKLLLDVIRNLTPDQVVIVKRIGFSSLLLLNCSSIPHDVFNWLARYMDTTGGSINLCNGFSFTISRECVQLILGLPLGLHPIPFSSTPEIVQRVNMEIHGKECSPTAFELIRLIKNGLSGAPFAKAFMLLANCLLLCPTNQIVPSSSYYYAISDADRISDFDWCSFVLHWLLLSVNKYQLNDHSGNCAGCGLIPVISYFEFLIVMEIVLAKTTPRLPLWTDNVLKLYAILDSKSESTFGNLPMKHLCSTPFARTSQKRTDSYSLPLDVVSYVESSYNVEEQKTVKKKLKTLSTNLHSTILNNTTRAITNCVDEVLRAFCNQNSTNARNASLYFNEGSLHCDDLLHDSPVITPDIEIKHPTAIESQSVVVKDASTSIREMLQDMIYYYMDSSFPPFPEVIIDEPEPDLFKYSSEIFTALVQTLPREEVPDLDFADIDDYLSRALVTKLEIPMLDEGYEPMSNIDICKLNLAPPTVEEEKKEEKIYFTDWVDCPQMRNFQETKEVLCSSVRSSSLYGLSLNERLTGKRNEGPPQLSESEFPEWNFSEDFEDAKSPSTPAVPRTIHPSTRHVSFKDISHSTTETQISSRIITTPMNKTTGFGCSISFDLSPSNKIKECPQADLNYSPLHESQGDIKMNKYFHSSPQKQTPVFHRYAFAASGNSSAEKESVQFISGNTCGLPVNERLFRPLSRKHVQSDNWITPSDLWFQDYAEDSSGKCRHIPVAFTDVFSAPAPSCSQKIDHNFSHPFASTVVPKQSIRNDNVQRVMCTAAEEELFSMLTTDPSKSQFCFRVFQIEERWAAEKTLALCMSDCGYINEYVMDAFVKMFLNDQKMNDAHGLKIGFLKHITYSEISEILMNPCIDIDMYKKLFTEVGVGFRLEHAGLAHVPCSVNKQWFLVVANFMDQFFDVLNKSHNPEALKPSIDAVVHNFKLLFKEAYRRTENFNIENFKVRYIKVPKQNFKFDSGFIVLVYMQTYNGFEIPDFSNEDLPALKKKLLFQLVSNYYNRAKKSPRINDFIARHVSPYW